MLTDFNYAMAIDFFQPLIPLSLDALSEKWEAWGSATGFPRTLSEERDFFDGFWDHLCDELNLSTHVCGQLHRFDYTTCMLAFPEARSALEAARQQGLKVGVLSNFSLASLDASLLAVGLADLVDVAVAAPVIGVSKPNPRAYAAVTNALDVSPMQCLFFDDEALCVEGANAVGMRAFRVDRGRNKHLLTQGIVCDLSVDLRALESSWGMTDFHAD